MATETSVFSEDAFESRREEPEGIEGLLLTGRIRTLKPPPAISLRWSAPVSEAVKVMRQNRIGAVLVMGSDGRLTGIFTERDVLTRIAGRPMPPIDPVLGEVMTPDPETLHLDDGIAYALNMMHMGGYRHVPVEDEATGRWHVVSVRDIARWIVDLFPDTVLTLPPDPEIREPDKETGG